MAALEHITPEQIAQYGVVAAPDRLTGRADDNKKIFDRLVRELVAVVVNEIIDKTNELLVDESVREENEKERVAAELLRVEAEKLRVQAENQRVTNEEERAQAEAARAAAEALSVQAENLRASAEQSRVDAEQERERAEAERESATRGIVTQATEQANLAAKSAHRVSDYEQRSSESARYAAESERQARSYADSARLSSISAGNSETKAKESEDNAKDSAALATDALGKGPYVDQSTKTWFVWDTRVGKFVDTGIKAEGKDGSTISATGLWGVEVDENGDLILTYTGDEVPPLSINEDGDLVYTLDGSEVNLGHVVGRDSQTPSITIGQVETLPAGSSVTASITGQTPNLVLNLGIPQGKQGDTGAGGGFGLPLLYSLTTEEEVRWIDTGDDAFLANYFVIIELTSVATGSNENDYPGACSMRPIRGSIASPWDNYAVAREAKNMLPKTYERLFMAFCFRGSDGFWSSIYSIRTAVNDSENAPNMKTSCGVDQPMRGLIIGDASAASGTRVLGAGSTLKVWGI